MRHHGTPLNSILFNLEMLLVSSAATAQFAQDAFADYARLTDGEVLFSAQIKYLSFYSMFFEYGIFLWLFIFSFVVAFIYLAIAPSDKPKSHGKKEDSNLKTITQRYTKTVDHDKHKKEKRNFFGKKARESKPDVEAQTVGAAADAKSSS